MNVKKRGRKPKRGRPTKSQTEKAMVKQLTELRRQAIVSLMEAGYVKVSGGKQVQGEFTLGDTSVFFNREPQTNTMYAHIVRDGDTLCRTKLVSVDDYVIFTRSLRKTIRYPSWKGTPNGH